MHPFIKTYTEVCKELLLPLGFKRKGRYFYRVVNDVYQNLALQLYSDGSSYDVYFGIYPFCCGITEYIEKAYPRFPLQVFTALPPYTSNQTADDADHSVRKLGQLIAQYIVPVYERTIDTATAFCEWNRFFQEAESRIDPRGRTPHCIEEDQIWMAIKTGEYDYAIEGLLQRIELDKKGYSTGNRQQFEEQVKEWEEITERIRVRDMKYLDNLIRENEDFSRKNLGLLLLETP